MTEHPAAVEMLVQAYLGPSEGRRALQMLDGMGSTVATLQDHVSRSELAAALNIVLFADLLRRVRTGAAYVSEIENRGNRMCFDHGALRTIQLPTGPTGALPPGDMAFRRLLEPLGYEVAGEYPLPSLRMTGRAYRHLDAPEQMPQFFVSELHVDRFDDAFIEIATRVFGESHDPLRHALPMLDELGRSGSLPCSAALEWLPRAAAAFGRQHAMPTLSDYRALASVSAEAAWIATEGNAFNHATHRVADLDSLVAEQRRLNRPIKDRVEISASGRVRQTAFHADYVEREFGDGVRQHVPGSFFEFIMRDRDPATDEIDLSFDSGNATGIFKMTAAV